MVFIQHKCNCGVCHGSSKNDPAYAEMNRRIKNGEMIFGGYICQCRCHDKKEETMKTKMTIDYEAEARRIYESDEYQHSHTTTECIDIISDALRTADEAGYKRGMERAINVLEEEDPLLATCEWETVDEIAEAVKDYLVDAIKKAGESKL